MTRMANDPEGAVAREVGRLFGSGTVAGLTEGQLLERFVANRDEAAFEALVVRHGPMVLGVCRRSLGDLHAAEDAFQATFLVLARRARSLSPRNGLGPWLFGVARRVSTRARSVAARRLDRDRLPATDPAAPANPRDPESTDLRRILDAEIARLPDRYRRPVLLCYLEGATHAEAASQLGWPIGTVKGRLARARDLLRTRLARRGLAFTPVALVTALTTEAAAALPEAVIRLTVRSAGLVAAGGLAGGASSAVIASLTQATLRSLLMTKLKFAVATFCGLGLAAMGVTVVAQVRSTTTTEPPTAPQAAPLTEAERIQGRWRCVELEKGGKRLPPDETHSTLLIAGDSWIVAQVNGENTELASVSYQIDPSRAPKSLDLRPPASPDENPRAQVVIHGIYQLEGDRLSVCVDHAGGERPTRFTTSEGSNLSLAIYRREGSSPGDEQAVKIPNGVAASAPAASNLSGSLLINGDLEIGVDLVGKSPTPPRSPLIVPLGWAPTEIPGVSLTWDHEVAHSGKSSLNLKKTASNYFPTAQWQQRIKRVGPAPRLKVSAWVKSVNLTKAVLDVQFNAPNIRKTHAWAAYLGSSTPTESPLTQDWTLYQGVVAIPDGTTEITIAPQIYGPGAVWFDDLAAESTDDPVTNPLANLATQRAASPLEGDPKLDTDRTSRVTTRGERQPQAEPNGTSPPELRVRLAGARKLLEHRQQLFKNGVISVDIADEAHSGLDLIRAQVQAARDSQAQELERLRIRLESQKARHRKAKADLAIAQADRDGITRLNSRGKGFVSEEELAKEVAQFQSAEAEADQEFFGVQEIELQIAQGQRRLDQLDRLDVSDSENPPEKPSPPPPAS